MNRKIAYTWIFLILFGFTLTDVIDTNNIFLLGCMWGGILLLGSTVLIKYGWKENKYLCLYWIISLFLGMVISGIQLQSLNIDEKILPLNHVSTIWMILLGVNFIISTIFSKIVYFLPVGIFMIAFSYPLDTLKLSYPATTYGIILSIVLIGYIVLSHITPNDPINLGDKYNEFNDEGEMDINSIHKFKCSNCNYLYEGIEKLDYCPRCMASSDLLIDVG